MVNNETDWVLYMQTGNNQWISSDALTSFPPMFVYRYESVKLLIPTV